MGHGVAAVLPRATRSLEARCTAAPTPPPRLRPRRRRWPVLRRRPSPRLLSAEGLRRRRHPQKHCEMALRAAWGAPRRRRYLPERYKRALKAAWGTPRRRRHFPERQGMALGTGRRAPRWRRYPPERRRMAPRSGPLQESRSTRAREAQAAPRSAYTGRPWGAAPSVAWPSFTQYSMPPIISFTRKPSAANRAAALVEPLHPGPQQ